MKEKLIAYFNRQLHYMDINLDGHQAYFDQAFGAVEFACLVLDDWDKESELIDLWNEEWRGKFEARIWGEI